MAKSTHLHESNTASLPPPGDMLAALSLFRAPPKPRRAQIISSASALAVPHKGSPNVSAQRPLPLIVWRVPADAGLCLSNSLRDRWQSYRNQLRNCRKDFSERSVHQLRVAARRLMTQYVLVGCVTPGDRAEKARRKLKRAVETLGDLRDTQVQKAFIESQMAQFPDLRLLRDVLRRRERSLVKRVAEKIRLAKMRKLEKWTTHLCKALAADVLDPSKREPLATRAFRATADAFMEVVRRRQTIDPTISQTIHSTRVAFKKFRYMIEALSPAFTSLGKNQLRPFATYQRRMGDLQDLENLQSFISQFIWEHPETESLLRPFCRCLNARRARSLRLCLNHTGDLFKFWGREELDQNHTPALVCKVASTPAHLRTESSERHPLASCQHLVGV